MGIGVLEAVQEEGNSEDNHTGQLWGLQEKLRRQSKATVAWNIKYRNENRLVTKLKKEKENYLQSIQTQLYVFESQLKKCRSEFDKIVQHKDRIIHRQHQLICNLTLALIKRDGHDDLKKIIPNLKLEKKNSTTKKETSATESENNVKNEKVKEDNDIKKQMIIISSPKNDFESLNDSDSAIMMEDAYDSLIAIPVGKGEVKVMRSVSDALEIISRGISSSVHNKTNPSVQTRRPGYGSLSSTPSCSSEESDDSPTSTIVKDRLHSSIDNSVSESILRLDKICSNLPLSAFTPYKSIDYSYEKKISQDSQLNGTDTAINNTSNHCCSRDVCESPSCWQDHSTSTTPLASPVQSPSISPTALRKMSLDIRSLESISNDKYDYDSDATLSDGLPDEGDSGIVKHHLGFQVDNAIKQNGDTVSIDKLTHFTSSTLRVTNSNQFHYPKSEAIQVTYNRVMSNHRSVTKPKDVKYKRINKAKSRSLEELRGKLKLSDGKQSISVDLDCTSDA